MNLWSEQMSSMDNNPQKAFKVKANNSLQTLEETQRNLNHITSEVHHKPSLMHAMISMGLYNSCSYQMRRLDSAGCMLSWVLVLMLKIISYPLS